MQHVPSVGFVPQLLTYLTIKSQCCRSEQYLARRIQIRQAHRSSTNVNQLWYVMLQTLTAWKKKGIKDNSNSRKTNKFRF